MNTIDKRLNELGITLPEIAKPVANYLPFTRSGNLLFVSGQLPFNNGVLLQQGLLGQQISIVQGQACARQCAINIIAITKMALVGNLEQVTRIVKLTGFVAGGAEFTDHPKVINGASDLMVDVFGDNGRHARAAVGVSALPLNAPVEVEAIIEVAGT